MFLLRAYAGTITAAALIAVLLVVTLLPYGGNPSALFHYGSDLPHDLPAGFVTLDVPSYDGAQYLRIARQFPLLLTEAGRAQLSEMLPLSYAYQRILLPKLAWILSLGQAPLLPWIFLAINVFALLVVAFVVERTTKNALAAVAIALSPAATLGLHFSLAEPLTILLLTGFLLRFLKTNRIGWIEVFLLSAVVLTREINVLFVGLVLLWLLVRRQWRDAAFLLIPLAIFGLWHLTIFSVFGDWPFFTSADKRGVPLLEPFKLLFGFYGYGLYPLSSIALLLLFVFPLFGWSVEKIVKVRDWSLPVIGACVFTTLMLTMPDHIWGSITSIGRVITPVYPCAILALAMQNGRIERTILSGTVLLGLAAGFGLALIVHPFSLS